MARPWSVMNWSERQQIIGGVVALVVGAVLLFTLSLSTTRIGGSLVGLTLALVSATLLVTGTLSIGTSDLS